jgi:muconate cycloisomerase
MARIDSFEIFSVDLPFRKPFKHAAAERVSSNSIFVKCRLSSGKSGYGECLPREYVTGESRDSAFVMLRDRILPRLVGRNFESYEEVKSFLKDCDGKAPADWIDHRESNSATWSSVDLVLLDSYGHEFNQHVFPDIKEGLRSELRYSAVLSADRGLVFYKTVFKILFSGIRQMKLKVNERVGIDSVKALRKILGRKADIRVDANMIWSVHQAAEEMSRYAAYGVHSFEQPVSPENIEDLVLLVRETGMDVMADESFHDRQSLESLIEQKACTAVNVRISKCGGLMASLSRCREAMDAGLTIQIGCQVGESSLLSAAQLALISKTPEVRYLEGCFGLLLLREDPVRPLLQFGYRGRPPLPPPGPGLGVEVDEGMLRQWTGQSAVVA